MRFTILSDEGERLGSIAFEKGRFDSEDLIDESLVDRIRERFREMRDMGAYDDAERLVRATLERVSADTGVRFVRDAGE